MMLKAETSKPHLHRVLFGVIQHLPIPNNLQGEIPLFCKELQEHNYNYSEI